MNVLFDTNFLDESHGHGGNRRAAQIFELICKAEPNAQVLRKNFAQQRFSWLIESLGLLIKGRIPGRISLHSFKSYGAYTNVYKKAFAKYSEQKLLVWEASGGCGQLVPDLAKEAGYRIIAAPQNLESLANQAFCNTEGMGNNLYNEVLALSRADAIFCISHEEQWLLNTFNLDAFWLPYYPDQSLVNNLLMIRNQRETHEHKTRLLLLGTVHNSPSWQGVLDVIGWLRKHQSNIPRLEIVGYGTEKLKPYCTDLPIQVHGGLTTPELEKLLLEAKAVLVHQKSGSGALTRIPEMLLAGIPVIASEHAARSATHYDGVYMYKSFQELEHLLAKSFAIPLPPARPALAEEKFVQEVVRLSARE